MRRSATMSRNHPAETTVVTDAHDDNDDRRRRGGSGRTRARSRGVTTLMYAAQQGDVDAVRRIIKDQPTSLFAKDRTGKSALHYSSTSDSIRSAQAADLVLMAAPDLVDGRDEDGFTPLHLAVIAGNMQLVTFLLANNADVNAVDNEKHTVVHWATVCGETAALRAVLAAGAPVSTPDVHGGYPLHYAAQMCGGDRDSNLGLQVLHTLLTHTDIVVEVTDGDKRQPLLWAASAGSARAVLALVRAGAAVEAADKDGLTALHCAASRGHTDCMDTLLTLCGASPDIIDSNGCTALHYAVTLGHADATALLLVHGADCNRQDRKGRSPAHCGCAKGQFETVKLIGSHGANLWLRNARGDLPLHDAAASGRRELVKWLLEMRPSQVNARNNDGRCPLHMAALNDNADMCKILLDAGAQINPILRTAKNIFMTPLDCALQRGYRSTAKYLQLHGGVPATRIGDPRNQTGNSALNLEIREDVTFWGDTSTESERENGEVNNKHEKMRIRKKIAHKHERRRQSLSGSEKNTARVKSGRGQTKPRRKPSAKTERLSSTKRINSTRQPSSRLDYSNEIIINGKTEINIHQTREIIVDKQSKTQEDVETGVKVEVPVTNMKERRPRSAKYSKMRERSNKSSTEKDMEEKVISSETVSKQNSLRKELSLKDQSTNTSEETPETIIETKLYQPSQDEPKFEKNNDIEESINGMKKIHDQQSIMSNTSEDIDIQKDLIVQAAVHDPPKLLDDYQTTKSNDIEISNNEIDNLIKPAGQIESSEVGQIEIRESGDMIEVRPEELRDVQHDGVLPIDEDASVNEIRNSVISDVTQVTTITQKCDQGQEKVSIPTDNILVNDEVSESTKIEEKPKEPNKDNNDTPVNKDVFVNNQSTTEEVSLVDETKEIELDMKSDQTEVNEELIKKDADIHKNYIKKVVVDIPTAASMTNMIETNEDHVIEKVIDKVKPRKRKKWDDKKRKGDTEKEVDKIEHRRAVMNNKKQNEQVSNKQKDEDYTSQSEDSLVSPQTDTTHKSFKILDDEQAAQLEQGKQKRTKLKVSPKKESRSKSEETKLKDKQRVKPSKIPTPVFKSTLSKSDKYLDKSHLEKKHVTELDRRIPSLPNIFDEKHGLKESVRCESNMSAPAITSVYSDNERSSDVEGEINTVKARRKVKRKARTRDARSAGSDYESSNLIDSGFEPSPRTTRIPRWKNMSERGVNMSSVTQNIQSNIRRYHLERKIFQQLLELKRQQIRAGQHNEAVLVKRAIDFYHQSCASTVGVGKYVAEDYTFKSFEKFLYEALRKLQKNGTEYMKGLPAGLSNTNPLLCTRSTNRCMHATHAYTGVPCAAYLPKMDHHTIPKIGFDSVSCKPGTGFLPNINSKKAVTLELSHGTDKQVISLPTDRLDQNKRYYVTFTVKGKEATHEDEESNITNAHRHSKSD